MSHRTCLEQAEAPSQVAVHRLDGSGLTYEEKRRACLFECRAVDEWFMDGRVQLRTEGQRYETMFNRMIIKRPRGTARDAVRLGMQVRLDGVARPRGAIGIFHGAACRRPPQLGQPRADRCE